MVRGDTLGLQLDLDNRTLAVALNGEVLGMMVRDDASFVPPLRWCVHLEGSGMLRRANGGDHAVALPTLRMQATPTI